MARVTVEDCIVRVPNRFDLVMRAAQRARAISVGSSLTVEPDNDKNPVVALREIADGTVDVEELRNSLIKEQQKHVEMDEPEEDEMDFIAMQQEMNGDMVEAAIAEDVPGFDEKGAEEETEPGMGEGDDEDEDATPEDGAAEKDREP
jgi:DNA-directed RNA polymerase subunit omega